MKGIREAILNKSLELKDEIIELRRHLHMNPELSFEEYETAAFICDFLEKNNIKFRKGVTGTGIIGELSGINKWERVVALRAEMDALPINEKNRTSYTSRFAGKMHACGHDSHMAMLLGTAKLLNSIRESFTGTVLLVFQPGEELAPGGAKLMIESHEIADPYPDIIIAQHVLPELETGKIGYKPGKYMASSDEIYITLTGKGGHAALPAQTTDQVYIASKLIIRLKDQIAREQTKVNIPTVLGFGRIKADGATNVIPDTVEIAGTFRTFDEKWRSEAKTIIENISNDTAKEFNITIDVNIVQGYPVLINNEYLTEKAIELSSNLLGKENVEILDLRMGSEDFAFFTERFPSLYFRTGIHKQGEDMKMLHTANFDIDEDGLVAGIANLSWLTINFLKDDDLKKHLTNNLIS
jgi:amidohydrolase